jgi:hypothetical protein
MEVTYSTIAGPDDKVGHKITMKEVYKDSLVCMPYDPFGHWKFSWEKGGEVPHVLEGVFTSWLEAEKPLKALIASKVRELESQKEREDARQAKEDAINEKSAKAREEWDAKKASEAEAEVLQEQEVLNKMLADSKKVKKAKEKN